MRVLLVDDEVVLGRALNRVLTSKGFDVVMVNTFEEGRVLLTTETFDILLTDFDLDKGHNGGELLNAAPSGIRKFLMSGRLIQWADPSVQFFAKPFSTVELVAALRGALV